VLVSAISEMFLRKLHQQSFINYTQGTEIIETAEEQQSSMSSLKLVKMDQKMKARLEKVKDLVLFRYWSTGVHDCLKKAVDLLQLIPVFPVKSIHNFTSHSYGFF
jgi:ribosome-binding ATPase YchF (GTP1/OBG family)